MLLLFNLTPDLLVTPTEVTLNLCIFLNFRIGGKKIIGGLALKGFGAITGNQGLYNLGKTITGLGVAKTIGAHLFNGK